ncbi:MAG TPA: trigger factor [Thermodesulfovibrionales bacterium]|nr:trigger factor [Thermodesulfovibrionales bacterium]
MLQTVEDISTTKKRLRIEIPADIIEREIKDSLERVRQKSKLPGYRPGKAPMNLIEKRYCKQVEAEVLEKVIPEFYNKALKEADLKPVTMPVFDEKLNFQRNNSLNLSLTVEVMPKIENIDYTGIKAKDIPITVDESELEHSIENLQKQKALYEVAEKEIEKDDLVTFDWVDGEIIGEETIPSLKEQILKLGNELLPMDIEEKLVGKKKGETVEITTTLGEDFRVKELAGKTVKGKIVIQEVKKKILPAIDDEFAKDLGFENISQLKEKIKENIYKYKKEQAVKIQKAEILHKIIGTHDFEVPETMLGNELDSLIMQSGMSDEQYKAGGAEDIQGADMINKTSEESRPEQEKKNNEEKLSELKEKALRNVRASVIINAIGKKEGIMVTEDEVKERIHLIAKKLSAEPEAVMNFYRTKDGSLEGLRQMIFEDKVLDLLLSKAILEEGE